MNKDIGSILEGWDYRPDEISVRKIIGIDGKEKVQMRLDLGLLQMEVDGRPDGKRPYGKESLLDYYESLVEEHRAKYETIENFKLDGEDCARLQQEGIQYYYRYLSFFHLEEYEKVIRDTGRNLRLFAFVRDYVSSDHDAFSFDQYRPYVAMMNTRAKASISLAKKDYNGALAEIESGIEAIGEFFKEYDRESLIESCGEVIFLRDWAKEIRENKPLTLNDKLEQRLKLAVEREDYEEAARLRDEMKKLKESGGQK